MSKIIVSVSGNTLEECLKALKGASYAELRLDLVQLNSEDIKTLMQQCQFWIVSVRETFLLKENYLQVFAAVMQNKPQYVDIDFEISDKSDIIPVLDIVKKSGCKLMLSYHNYEQTPSEDFLEKTAKKMLTAGASMMKIVCMANSFDDNLMLSNLYKKFPDIIAFGMGEQGKMSRIASLFLGDGFAYAAPDHGAFTAPGQLRLSEMQQIAQLVNKS
jgi:3-dehydroquinate dehydratase I